MSMQVVDGNLQPAHRGGHHHLVQLGIDQGVDRLRGMGSPSLLVAFSSISERSSRASIQVNTGHAPNPSCVVGRDLNVHNSVAMDPLVVILLVVWSEVEAG